VQLYSEVFEKQFLESTKEFYAAEGVQYLRDSEVAFIVSLEVKGVIVFR
jgi:hypothetical protein